MIKQSIHTSVSIIRNMEQAQQPSLINIAMNMGAVVGVYYIAKFCLFPLSLHSTLAAMLFLGLTLMVPFLVYRLTKLYRDRYMGGYIDFTQALVFVLLIMGFGSLLVAAAHYIYFAYIDGGMMVGALEQSIAQLSAIDLSTLEGIEGTEDVESTKVQFDQYIGMMHTTAAQIKAMTPIDMTLGMLSNNVSWAIAVALPVALFVRRNKVKE